MTSPQKDEPWSLTARWIFPVERPPIHQGTIVIEGDRILAVETHRRSRVDFDFGNVAVLPGFVNAHAHLDLTGLHDKCPPSPNFTGWLESVIAHRRNQTRDQIEPDVREGIRQCLATGTTTVGDIASQGWSLSALREAPIRSTIFYELLGLTEERAAQAWEAAYDWLTNNSADSTCRLGLSPHAPYSVRNSLFSKVAEYCRRHAKSRTIPVAVHVAESYAELELLRPRTGPFEQFLRNLGVWDPDGLIEGLPALLQSFEGCRPIFVHANYLSPDAPFPQESTVVYCPRTHDAFGHPPHPFQAFLDKGVRVAIGTDGLSSNPDLSILEEIRYLRRRYPELLGEILLRMATLSGAEALGWSEECGSLSVGKSADLVVLPISTDTVVDPHDLILSSTAGVERTLFQGRKVKC